MSDGPGAVRLDRWLWAARFFKTRALAAEAIEGGKVHLNGTRGKRGKMVKPGDRLRIRKGPYETRLVVQDVVERRLPAKEAVRLYEESPESIAARKALADQHKLAAGSIEPPRGRPGKRDRRLIARMKGKS